MTRAPLFAARSLLAPLLLLLFLLPFATWAAPAPLLLDDARGHVDAWPALTVLSDPGGQLDIAGARAAAARFTPPDSAYATLGVHRDVVWLRIPVVVADGSDGDWILNIDYAPLNRVDVYVSADGTLVHHEAMGNLLPGAPSGARGRAPAMALKLAQGSGQELWLRVENTGSMILPIRLSTPAAFHAAALNEQMLQGLLTGLSLCLLLYSLAQWINLREPLFGKYALLTAGTTMFSVEFFGLGGQYLWGSERWMTMHAGGLFALMASCGAYLFVEQALARPGMDRVFSRLMRGGAVLALLSALAYATDLIGVQTLVAIVSTLGLMPMLLGLPGAFMRARRGDAVGIYFLIGWAVSFMSSVLLSRVINGAVAANFWTMHALQFGNMFDMLVFMRILGLRTKAMQSAMLRAEAATRMKSDFLANMSHEIRTPLNAIIGMSQLAMMAEPSPRLRNYVSKIEGAGQHLLGIINDILDFSKIEAGKLALETVPFALDDLLEHLASLTAIKTDAKRVELVFRVERGVPARLVGDPLRVGQILINLTSNAVKFTDRGEIVVAVDATERKGEQVTLRFSVSDTGIGMDEEQLVRLFQSFSQADGSITRRYGGTGLGLSISKQLVELMGGAIRVNSTPGVGSRFSFTVTLGVADPASAPVAPPAAALQQVRVMVVDDSATARDALVEMLASFGVTAHGASSGEQSLYMLARAADEGLPYQVVLMDYMMPGWDGVETIRRIQADPRLAAPPAILMVSACTRETVQQQEGQFQLHGFLTKPVGPALLYHSLLQVLRPDLAGPDVVGLGMRAPDLARLAGARILLVDDNANNREVAQDFLAMAQVEVDVALHGGEAVRMVQERDYDLVLMDIQMQEVDGLTATMRIRALPELRQPPIIAMTAHAMAGDRDKSLAAGMNDHVTKPINPELLFRALHKWIDPARLAGRQPPAAPMLANLDDSQAGTGAPLPPVPGIIWQQALDAVGQQRARLHKRIASFLREYQGAPQVVREALDAGHHQALQSLAHNLKSSAAYLGAAELSALANSVEQALRSGQHERCAALAPELADTLATVLAGLAAIVPQPPIPAAAPGPAAPDAPAPDMPGAATLIRQLEAFLRHDDARAEDALHALQALPGAARHGALLAAIQQAVDEIEYDVALAPLAQLALALNLTVEPSA
ncbi:hybrid sensor histidine kinase/response regulator [Rugamonas apoptosis]|uniref:Virulence sensor protein BvgS n=1 Tax=Rugamonas apoptosis TaxID=2758570 RepID=A0A7W2IKZ6_9BURK|nr:hybrid sensor histidine kinase/response regulator [Rugamonas apoptosis]MBA5687901.1 response regulator [Rugamonas apoptosis]